MGTRVENLDEIYALSATTQRLMRAHMQASHASLGIGPSEGHLLYMIAEAQPVSLKKLADSMHLTPGAITQLVDSLVEAGFVLRASDKHDRRVTVVSMTPEGARKFAAMRQYKEEVFAKFIGELSDKELAAFVNIQRKMLQYLEENCQKH